MVALLGKQRGYLSYDNKEKSAATPYLTDGYNFVIMYGTIKRMFYNLGITKIWVDIQRTYA